MTALTITHHIAAPLEVIPADLGLKAQNLATASKVLEIVDAATYEAGNRLLVESHGALKELEAARVKLKKPITDLGREIDKIVGGVAEPLEVAKRNLQGRVVAYQRAEQEKAERARREAEDKARLEREAAEKERQCLQAEADAKHAAEVAAAKAKAEADAKELEAILGKPVEAAPVVVAAAPVIEAKPVVAPVVAAPIVAKAAVTTRKVQRVEFTDRAAVPVLVAGRVIRPIDEAAVKALLMAGVAVPGAHLVEAEVTAMARA